MKTKPGFNGQGVINLSDFDQLQPREQNNARFIGYDFLDLDEIDVDDEDYFNLAIRDERDESRVEALTVSYSNNGFLTKYFPPCFGTDGRPRDGRTRIKAAKMNGERWIPIAIYSYEDNSLRNYVTNGLVANDHDPATPPRMENFITAGVTLIKEGELKCDETSVSEWLYKEALILKFFNNNRGGVISKIIDGIIKRGSGGGEPLTHRQSREKWIEWVGKNLKRRIDNKCVLMCVDNTTYSQRAWCDYVLPSIVKCDDPVDFILYTNEYIPEKARINMNKFVKNLKSYHECSFRMVNNTISGITIQVSNDLPYNIIGAVPQVYQKHDLSGRSLIPIDQY